MSQSVTGSPGYKVRPPGGWALDPAIDRALRADREGEEVVAAMTEALCRTGSRDQNWAIDHMSLRALRGVVAQLASDYLGRDDLPVDEYSPRALRLIAHRVLKGRREDARAAAEEVAADV